MLFVITGPSGCGKSTLVHRILKEVESVDFSVSYTTRKKRDNEQEGKDYYFVSKEKFERLIEENTLMEWAVVHGHFYGTSKKELEKKGTRKSLLLDIDVQGASNIKDRTKKATFIFILPPEFKVLQKRLEDRGQDNPDVVRKRLEMARKEIRSYSEFDYIIVNDQQETAVLELKSIIISKRCRLDKRQLEIQPILRSFFEAE